MLDWFLPSLGGQLFMPGKRKKFTISANKRTPRNELAERIKLASEGLWYMSETDAEIFPFIGKRAESVTKENLLAQIGEKSDAQVEERDYGEFFARLTKIQDWFGEEEKETAEKYAALGNLLEKNLKDLRVSKVGQIQLDLFVVGLDAQSNLMGIKTKAVET
jgi:hypothetical protein